MRCVSVALVLLAFVLSSAWAQPVKRPGGKFRPVPVQKNPEDAPLDIPAEKRPAFIQQTLATVEPDDPATCLEASRILTRLGLDALPDLEKAPAETEAQKRALGLARYNIQRADDEAHGRPIHGQGVNDFPEPRTAEQTATALKAKAATLKGPERIAYLVTKIRLHPYEPPILRGATDQLAAMGKDTLESLKTACEQAPPQAQGPLAAVVFQLSTGTDSRQTLNKWLEEHLPQDTDVDAQPARPVYSPALIALFPDTLFYTLVMPQWPVARMAPEPLTMQNVFAVDKAGKVTHITALDSLKAFFQAHLPRIEEKNGKQAVVAWLGLSQTFAQDGMFTFVLDEGSYSWQVVDAQKAVATGKLDADPASGNTGSISVTLTLKNGKLEDAQQKAQLEPGIRPICQATKLLDPDPIVRKMVQRDILVMGRGCRPYLLEQRAKAAPEIQHAIDSVWEQILVEGR